MLMRHIVVLTLIVASAATAGQATAQERLRLATTPPPIQAVVRMGKDGRVVIRSMAMEFRQSPSKIDSIMREQTRSIDLAQLHIYDDGGNRIDSKTIHERLKA